MEKITGSGISAGVRCVNRLPDYGVDGVLRGTVSGIDPSEYRLAVYIQIEGVGWWTKPYLSLPMVTIQPDGTWVADVATGGIDNRATLFAAALVPRDYSPPLAQGAGRLPAELEQNALAIEVVEQYSRVVKFAGRRWAVKESPVDVGPGGNRFSDDAGSVFVDENGALHLKLRFHDGGLAIFGGHALGGVGVISQARRV